jgi:hypothetical protein
MRQFHGRSYPEPRTSQAFQDFKKTRAADIHAIYEETMLEIDPATALSDVDALLAGGGGALPAVGNGHQAAVATVELMFASQARLAPMDIIEADDPAKGPKARARDLWNNADVRTATIASLADSVRLLAHLWTTAWAMGHGDDIPATELRLFSEAKLDDLYRNDQDFARALSLASMAQSGSFEP